MPLADTLKNFAKSLFAWNDPVNPSNEDSGLQRPVPPELREIDKESLRTDRQSKIAKCKQMQRTDARVNRALRKLASDAAIGGCSIVVESATSETVKEQAQIEVDSLFKRIQFEGKLKGWIRSLMTGGDLFLQVFVDETTQEITRLKKLAPSITFSNMNPEGNFPENEPAYYQEHPLTREKTKTFEAWEVVHLKWEEEDGEPYGEPLFGAARLAYDRLDSAEKNIVIRRATRAGMQRHHKVGGENATDRDWKQVEEHKRRNRDTLSNPLSPIQDWFTTGNITIETLQGDTELQNLQDVEYFEGLLSIVSGIPLALLGGGREKAINRDVLEEQEEDYYRTVADINEVFETLILLIANFQLLLKGFNPDGIEIAINWGAKDRDDLDAKIDRAVKLQQLGFSFETIFHTCDLDKIDLDEELERIKNQVAEGVIPYGIGINAKTDLLTALGTLTQPQSAVTEELMELRTAVEAMGNGHKPLDPYNGRLERV